jgi:hypothetical protein
LASIRNMLAPVCCVVVAQVRARDQESKWLTALALMDDDTYLAADNSSNMVSRGFIPLHPRIRNKPCSPVTLCASCRTPCSSLGSRFLLLPA